MIRYSRRVFAIAAVCVAAGSAACSDLQAPTNPAVGGSRGAQLQDDAKPVRNKDEKLDTDDGGLYIDLEAGVLHNGRGSEAHIGKKNAQALAAQFRNIARRNAVLAAIEEDPKYQQCLSGALSHMVRVTTGEGAPKQSLAPFARPSKAGLIPGAPSFNIEPPPDDDPMSPTFCQGAAMGLYNATNSYKAAVGAYAVAVAATAASGVTIEDGLFSYDGKSVWGLTGIVALDLAAQSVETSWIQCNYFGYQMRAGGCLGVGAQYGYFTDPVPYGMTCHDEWMRIEWNKIGTQPRIGPSGLAPSRSLAASRGFVVPSRPSYEMWEGWVQVCE